MPPGSLSANVLRRYPATSASSGTNRTRRRFLKLPEGTSPRSFSPVDFARMDMMLEV